MPRWEQIIRNKCYIQENLSADYFTHIVKFIINLVDNNGSEYKTDNINTLFINELELLINDLDYKDKEFDLDKLSDKIKIHLMHGDIYKIRYFK